jgi:hypothetical protein
MLPLAFLKHCPAAYLHVRGMQQLLQVLQVQPQHQDVCTAHHSTAAMTRMAQRGGLACSSIEVDVC